MTSLRRLELADTTGECLRASLLVIGVKFGINGTPLDMSRDTGVEVFEPVIKIFLGFGLKTPVSVTSANQDNTIYFTYQMILATQAFHKQYHNSLHLFITISPISTDNAETLVRQAK